MHWHSRHASTRISVHDRLLGAFGILRHAATRDSVQWDRLAGGKGGDKRPLHACLSSVREAWKLIHSRYYQYDQISFGHGFNVGTKCWCSLRQTYSTPTVVIILSTPSPPPCTERLPSRLFSPQVCSAGRQSEKLGWRGAAVDPSVGEGARHSRCFSTKKRLHSR